jgi:S1-C subfamily serine protease
MVDIPSESLRAHDFKAESAALRFHHAVYGAPPTTSLDGAACKRPPKHGEIPVLEAGVPTKGCHYKAYPDNHTTGGAGYLDVPKLYQLGKEQGVHIKTDLPPHRMGKELVGGEALGSGVIVGKRKDELLVLTDNHAVPETKGAATFVKLGDGKEYRARVVSRDPAHDGAILAVETGKDTDKEYKPAKIANDLSSFKHGAKALIVGYPERSRTPYASPADTIALARANELGPAVRMPGEDTRRQLAVFEAQTHEGNSGGPTYNPKGELVGTLEGGPDPRSPDALSVSLVNPITKSYVDGLIRRAKP